LIFSPPILEQIPEQELMAAFARHDQADWGSVSPEVARQNQRCLRHGGKLVSQYAAKNGTRFRIETAGKTTYLSVV